MFHNINPFLDSWKSLLWQLFSSFALFGSSLWMHLLIRKAGCWKENWFCGVVPHFQIQLCFYQEQLPEHKPTRTFFARQLLPQGCPLRGLPNNANRKTLRALKQSEELLSITDSVSSQHLPSHVLQETADEREDSKGPLELFQLPQIFEFHWFKWNSKYTQPRLIETTLQLVSQQAQLTTI